ncbi:hypothetical protein OPQ81_004936 [Rhizoctonia solani]|nr:hypothetical protein OPQ81_004936 [Rhizoctonia solani]
MEWSRRLTLRKVEDWKIAIDRNLANYVRELILEESALPSHTAVKTHLDFSRFDLIRALTLDCHNDVGHSASLGAKGQWSYKKIIPNLPRKLKSLTILNAHGPDLQVIQKAIKQCKGLEALTLGRCTKFNRPCGCEFWENFPNDHDSYFSGKGVDGYASALGTELQGLLNLKEIFVNVYLTDTKYLNQTSSTTAAIAQVSQPSPPSVDVITVTTKRTSHAQTPGLHAPMDPSPVPNEQSEAESKDRKDTQEAEEIASKTLFDCHPSLQVVGFISFWSEDHLGWSIRERKDIDEVKSPDPGGKWDGISTLESPKSI